MTLNFLDKHNVSHLVKRNVKDSEVSRLIEEDLKERHRVSTYHYFKEWTDSNGNRWIDYGSPTGREFYVLLYWE